MDGLPDDKELLTISIDSSQLTTVLTSLMSTLSSQSQCIETLDREFARNAADLNQRLRQMEAQMQQDREASDSDRRNLHSMREADRRELHELRESIRESLAALESQVQQEHADAQREREAAHTLREADRDAFANMREADREAVALVRDEGKRDRETLREDVNRRFQVLQRELQQTSQGVADFEGLLGLSRDQIGHANTLGRQVDLLQQTPIFRHMALDTNQKFEKFLDNLKSLTAEIENKIVAVESDLHKNLVNIEEKRSLDRQAFVARVEGMATEISLGAVEREAAKKERHQASAEREDLYNKTERLGGDLVLLRSNIADATAEQAAKLSNVHNELHRLLSDCHAEVMKKPNTDSVEKSLNEFGSRILELQARTDGSDAAIASLNVRIGDLKTQELELAHQIRAEHEKFADIDKIMDMLHYRLSSIDKDMITLDKSKVSKAALDESVNEIRSSMTDPFVATVQRGHAVSTMPLGGVAVSALTNPNNMSLHRGPDHHRPSSPHRFSVSGTARATSPARRSLSPAHRSPRYSEGNYSANANTIHELTQQVGALENVMRSVADKELSSQNVSGTAAMAAPLSSPINPQTRLPYKF